jgi:hypothetical protein
MYYDFVEQLAEWFRKQGGWEHWMWMMGLAVLSSILGAVIHDTGWSREAKILSASVFLWWVVGAPLVVWAEHGHKKKMSGEEDDRL